MNVVALLKSVFRRPRGDPCYESTTWTCRDDNGTLILQFSLETCKYSSLQPKVDTAMFKCPICNIHSLVLSFGENVVYDCKWNLVDEYLPLICTDCQKHLDFLTSTYNTDEIELIMRKLGVLGE